jgi:hypothetical protein
MGEETMSNQNEFWQRRVTDTLAVELIPGEQPSLLIKRDGESLVEIEVSELQRLVEALTVAMGELLILKKDPATLAQVQRLLEKDMTLVTADSDQRSAAMISENSNPLSGQELIRRYRKGERSFPKANLCEANLRGADLRKVNLSGADLAGVNLERANLCQANLEEANLFQASLGGADLRRANLSRANLGKANLTGAKVTTEQLSQARSLRGARMPDGTKHA